MSAGRPWQFGLKTLFAATTVVAVATALVLRSPEMTALTVLMALLDVPLIGAAVALSRVRDPGWRGALVSALNGLAVVAALYVGLAAVLLAVLTVMDALAGGGLMP